MISTKIIKKCLHQFKPALRRSAAFIINYNMPKEADDIYQFLQTNIKLPLDIYLIDNASDVIKKARHTNVFLKKNVQMTNGLLQGMRVIRWKLFRYQTYTFISTSTKFTKKTGDFIAKANNLFINNESCVGYHPSLSPSSRQAFLYMINIPGSKLRKASFLETVCVTYKADWFDSIGRFDPRFIYGWGIDLETGYLARRDNKVMYIDDSSMIIKNYRWSHKSKRSKMSFETKKKLAMDNMVKVFTEKYGIEWSRIIHKGITADEITGYREFYPD